MDQTRAAGHPLGLVLELPKQQFGEEPYYHEIIAGIENVLLAAERSLVVRIVPDAKKELATYTEWSDSGMIEGVFLVNLIHDDPRVSLLQDLGLPAVVIGSIETAGPFPAVWTDDASAMRLAVHRLFELGHRNVGRVSGPPQLAHSQTRTHSFAETTAELGIQGTVAESQVYSEASGQIATRELLGVRPRPTAIIYDDDVMAIGGLRELSALDLNVPHDVSILAWDDSPFCQLSKPPLSVMGHDVQTIGELAAQSMLAQLTGTLASHEGPMATFIQRGSVIAINS
jgi:DNA-binding LacI/PurR family transcriptional regulator